MKEKVKINFKEIWDDVWVNGSLLAIGTYFMHLLGM
jgi:hypothetical protein